MNESPTKYFDALDDGEQAMVNIYMSNGFLKWTAYRDSIATTDNYESLRTLAARKFADVRIKLAIAERMKEGAMAADEVLRRLSEQAGNHAAEFIDEHGNVDLVKMKDAGMMHLVKGTKRNAQGALIVEFYDAQSALKELAHITSLRGPKGTEEDPLHHRIEGFRLINGPDDSDAE